VNSLSDTERAVLVEGLDDWVGIWSVVREVREQEGRLADEEVRRRVVDLVRRLSEGGYIRIGHPTAEGDFRAWGLTASEAAERIVSQWGALRRDPDIGEICWLENTDLGDRAARQDIHKQQ
jgi:hypothetical protein